MKKRLLTLTCLIFSISTLICLNLLSKPLSSGKCGQKSLSAVLKKLNNNFEDNLIYSRLNNSELTILEIKQLSDYLGFTSELKNTNIWNIRHEKPLGILHIDGHHFVGLVGYDSQTIHIAETGYEGPPRIERWSDGDLMARWDGVILVISKPKDGTIPPVAAQKAAPKTTAAR